MMIQEIPKALYAYIGGSGTWCCEVPQSLDMPAVRVLSENMEFETPFGVTAPLKLLELDASITADHEPRRVIFAPVHGCNIEGVETPQDDNHSERLFWLLKQAGVRYILSDGSGGGINPLMEPGDIIIPHDFIDFTKREGRANSLADGCILRMRDAICPDLRKVLYTAAEKEYRRVFRRGVYAVTDLARFESPAEVQMLYNLHCDICAQSLMPEVANARAIGACWAGLYIVSNFAEGINPDWETPLFDLYGDCAVKIGRLMLNAVASIDPATMDCHCVEYVIPVPKTVQDRTGETY